MATQEKLSQGTILLVDDEAALVRSLSRYFEYKGFEVTTAFNGPDALKKLEEGQFEAVISDITMPVGDGIELLRDIRKRDLDLPVILMTGAPTVETAAKAVEYGAFKYLTKPVPPEELVGALLQAVRLCRLARSKREALTLLGTQTGEASGRAGLETSFARALDSLWMAYQPIVRASDRSLFGYEALLRSEEKSLPHPGAVLDAAERLGQLPRLSRAIRERITRDMQSADPSWVVFVNLHPRDLLDPELVGEGARPFEGVAGQVVLEITERAALETIGDVPAKVAGLRQQGFRIAVDDLGAGYAGLASFVQLQPEIVKIDMSLTRFAHTSPVKQKLVRSVASLCHDMGLLVVAEGVETAEERDVLIEMGCDLLQGYYFGRPERPFVQPTW